MRSWPLIALNSSLSFGRKYTRGIATSEPFPPQVQRRATLLSREAMRLNPECPRPLVCYAYLRGSEGKLDEAVDLLRRACAMHPKSGSLLAELAKGYAIAHQDEKAFETLQQAVPYAYGSSQVEESLTQCAAWLKRIDLGVVHAQLFLQAARREKLTTNETHAAEESLRFAKILEPGMIKTARPRQWSAIQLREELEKRLTPTELALVVNPIESSDELNAWARELVDAVEPPLARALLLFKALSDRTTVKGSGGARTAKEAFAAWKNPTQAFSCQEYAKLFVVLSRAVGIESYVVHVDRDVRGFRVDHDCAVVFLDGKAVLADPSFLSFGVQHKEFLVLSDLEAIAHHACQPQNDGKNLPRVALARKLHPNHAWTELLMIVSLINEGKLDLASSELGTFRTNYPPHSGAFMAEALIAEKRRQWPNAMDQAQRSLALDPRNIYSHRVVSDCLIERKDFSGARPHLLKIVELADETHSGEMKDEATTALKAIDQTLALVHGSKDAFAEFKRRADAGDGEAQYNLGVILFKKSGVENERQALVLFRRSATNGYLSAQKLLAEIYSQGSVVVTRMTSKPSSGIASPPLKVMPVPFIVSALRSQRVKA